MELNNDKNLISLKEAAEISGYSSDYVGQLIRSGKIPGKQVYCNVAWMTTKEAVLDYKNKGKSNNQKVSLKDKIFSKKRQVFMELDIIRLFFKTFKTALPILLVVIISFFLLSFYFLYLIFDNSNIVQTKTKIIEQNKNTITY
ncbi:hypothetical protein A2531_04385 [Candidatus Falkowbacteria bacterium RIFOXYD2_FULL_34_120]|uniref:Helix-turn-helix domain-containing protein n=1 Tax=Candidatus Falkowbacteria bacterium RIFOXYD2_FULL_34_120 TaxID=1798007 RepID=A0A1F5TQ06_9BACT|nr:MAG: hypothetical protein A2466_01335 [Candidatus Falkowbacteria bacterium RIFOXYC2_FULL_34_220]OGF38659.1 MAG: hypothetical protein A2515_04920 [Candidatus Falkowbacteria bacterium RIFOXYD12_FULL_34_57]OGF40976.1 MAG: hypothetical protein A2531_04385 [Candidatus Falkowbacteria bacterium RIFOXYD2_FULL_34_120]